MFPSLDSVPLRVVFQDLCRLGVFAHVGRGGLPNPTESTMWGMALSEGRRRRSLGVSGNAWLGVPIVAYGSRRVRDGNLRTVLMSRSVCGGGGCPGGCDPH